MIKYKSRRTCTYLRYVKNVGEINNERIKRDRMKTLEIEKDKVGEWVREKTERRGVSKHIHIKSSDFYLNRNMFLAT